MNYKSKKAIFDEKIIDKEELSDATRKKLRDSKYLILLLDIFMICVNGFMLTYFIIKGFNPIVLALLCTVLVMDVIHFGLSFVLNYRFKYNIVFTLIYSVVSLLFTIALYILTNLIGGGTTIFETVGVGVSIAVRVVYFVALLITMLLIVKKKVKIVQPIALILVAGLLFGATITYNVVRGVYGIGSGFLDGNRTLEYRLSDDNLTYNIVGSLDSNYNNIVIPDEFNGRKVRGVDYSLFLTEGVKNFDIKSTEPIEIFGSEEQEPIADEITLSINKDVLNSFKRNIYNSEGVNSNLTKLANKVDPILPSNEFAIKFNFDATNMPAVLKGKYIDNIYVNRNAATQFSLQTIFEANPDFMPFFEKNYKGVQVGNEVVNDYKWNYDAIDNQKAMVMDTNLRTHTSIINDATDINIHFEDVVKVKYNFSPNQDDFFEIGFVDMGYIPNIEKEKYVISSDVSAIEMYSDIRTGSTVKWSLSGDRIDSNTIINSKETLAQVLVDKKIRSSEVLEMQANWTMNNVEKPNLVVVDANGQETSGEVVQVTYGDKFQIRYDYTSLGTLGTHNWIVKEGTSQLISAEYTDLEISDILLAQDPANGVSYTVIENQEAKDKVLSKLLSAQTPTSMQITYTATDEYWSALTGNASITISLVVAKKGVDLEWKDGENALGLDVFGYDAMEHMIAANIKSGICEFDTTNNMAPSITMQDNTVRNAVINHAVSATIKDNTNYIINTKNGQADVEYKNITINKARIRVTYSVTNGLSDAVAITNNALPYHGYSYNVTPEFTDANTWFTRDSIDRTSLYSLAYPQVTDNSINEAGEYTYRYTFAKALDTSGTDITDGIKGNYEFVSNEYRFIITKAKVQQTAFEWSKDALEYNGAAQYIKGTFKGIGNDKTTYNIASGRGLNTTNAGVYTDRSVQILDNDAAPTVLRNYELDGNPTHTYRITKKHINISDGNNITVNGSTAVFANRNIANIVNGFSIKTIDVNSKDLVFTITGAKFNTNTDVEELRNAGTYSDIKVQLTDKDYANYTFSEYDVEAGESSYSNNAVYVTAGTVFTITPYALLATDIQQFSNKVYDAGATATATTINSVQYGSLTYDVTVSSIDDKNVGTVNYTIKKADNQDAGIILANYNFNAVEAETFSYDITKRSVGVRANGALEYTGTRSQFSFTVTPTGVGNINNCIEELATEDFINYVALNAVNAGAYTISDAHIADTFKNNYTIDNANTSIATVTKYDLTAHNNETAITWDDEEQEYNGTQLTRVGTFSAIDGTGTEITLTSTGKQNVKYINNVVDKYTFVAPDFTFSDTPNNYTITDVSAITLKILPKNIQVENFIDTTIPKANTKFEYEFNGTSVVNTSAKVNGADTNYKISAFAFAGIGSDATVKINATYAPHHGTAFINATTSADNQIQSYVLTLTSSNLNYVINVADVVYSIQINKAVVNLALAESLEYNGAAQWPTSSSVGNVTVRYSNAESNIAVADNYTVKVSLDNAYLADYDIKTSVNGTQGTEVEHTYAITTRTIADLNNNENVAIEYKATQKEFTEMNDVTFNTMTTIDKMVYNAKPWYVIAKITVKSIDMSGKEVTEMAYVYTDNSTANITATNAGTYNIATSSIEVYAQSTLSTDNYNFTTGLQKEFTIAKYTITKAMIAAYIDSQDNSIFNSQGIAYNGLVRTVTAVATPTFASAVPIELTATSTETIQTVKAYSIAFALKVEDTANYQFAQGVDTATVNIVEADIEVSNTPIAWDATTISYAGVDATKFRGTLELNGAQITITSNFAKNDAGTYTNGSGYVDTDFVLSDTNYKLKNVSNTFIIEQFAIDSARISWSNGTSTANPDTPLSAPYNFGKLPNITAKFTTEWGYEINFRISGKDSKYDVAVVGYALLANIEGSQDITNFKITGEYIDADTNYAKRTVPVVKLSVSDADSIIWKYGDNSYTVGQTANIEYTGSSILPIAYVKIGENEEQLTLSTTSDNINVGSYKVTIGSTQNNFMLDGISTEFNYNITKKSLSATAVLFENNKGTANAPAFEYNEGSVVEVVAYVMINGVKANINVSGVVATAVGTNYTMTVSYSGTNFELQETTITYAVVAKDVTYVWSNMDDQIFDVDNKASRLPVISLNGIQYTKDAIIEGLQVKVNGEYQAFVNGTDLVNAGTYDIKFVSDMTGGNYNITNAEQTFTILKKDISSFTPAAFSVQGGAAALKVTHTGNIIDKPIMLLKGTAFSADSIVLKVPSTTTVVNELKDVGAYDIYIECSESEQNFSGSKKYTTSAQTRFYILQA